MKVLGNVIKSASDHRTYKAIQLNNKIQCLIVSDQETQKSSAALSVGVGSLLDPIEAQGLAHYLEHMLFMGTQKYPQQNDYMNFIAKNSGSSNAYTSQQQTNFHFQVSSNAFVSTLDRFAQFFISPLMLDSSSQRQLNAVHSEHSKNLQNDSWRKYQLTKHLAKAGHPYGKFSTGDKTSLGNPNLRKMLFDFYNSHYSANLMKMVVYGRENVDQLGQTIVKQFSPIKNLNYSRYKMKQHPFDEKMLQKKIKVVPVQDKRSLQISWILSDKSTFYLSSPSKYISHILGHQGKSSFLSFLISQGLATSLSVGGHDNYQCYQQFSIFINLTDKGFSNINKVIGHVMYAIEKLKHQQPEKYIFDQIKSINKINFDFMEKRQGLSYVSHLVKRLHTRKVQQVLYYPYAMEEWQPDIIKGYLNELKAQNMMIMCENKKYQSQANLVQPIYKTKYSSSAIGELSPLQCKIQTPSVNPFVPKNLELLPLGQSSYPIPLNLNSTFIEAYFKQDHRFNLPKSEINLKFYFKGQNNVRNDVVRRLFDDMLGENLREFAYVAGQAGLHSDVGFANYFTMSLTVTGFRDSFQIYINQFLQKIFAFQPTNQALFQTLKQKLTKNYANQLLSNPYQIAYDSLMIALREGSSQSPKKKLQAIPSITFKDIQAYAIQWKKSLYSQLLISGNLSQAQALSIGKSIVLSLSTHSHPLNKSFIPTIHPIILPSQHTSIIEQSLSSPVQTNNSIIVHFQYKAFQVRTKLLQDLAQAFVKEPAFDYLRTKEQLGYIVMCLQDDNRGVLGMSLLIQSNIKTTHQLVAYVDRFVNNVLTQSISKLTPALFQEYKTGLMATKMQKDKNLSQQSARFWSEIAKHKYMFNRKQQELQIIPTITLQQFKTFLQMMFYQNARRFQIHESSQNSIKANEQFRKKRISQDSNIRLYENIDQFRKKMDLYPDFYRPRL